MRMFVGLVIVMLTLHGFALSQSGERTIRYRTHHSAPVILPDYQYPEVQREMILAQAVGGEEVFRAVQRGLAQGNIEEITRHFGKHIYLNLRSGESGYYSANQAQFVIQNFFHANRPLSFSFTTYGESGGSPFATGRGSINVKGNREYIQVYVALSRQQNKWVISQFNVY